MKRLFALCVILFCLPAHAAYSNYSSVLLGSRAAGMGGAFTALGGDTSASPFYNPATTILTKGNSLSATVNLYTNYSNTIGETENFKVAPQRLNQGYFRSLPSTSSTTVGFESFAFGLTFLTPDYSFYSGQVKGSSDTTSFLSQVDESLWAGATLSVRLTESDSAGVTVYYTARNFSRTVNDQVTAADNSGAQMTNEVKNLTANSIVPVIGYFHRLSPQWTVGVSYRPPSLPIAGEGTYYRATTTTSPYSSQIINRSNLQAVTKIPARFAFGFAREIKDANAISFDVQLYEGLAYRDLPELPEGADSITHRPLVNFAIGYEQVLREWLRLRMGFFTNLSSHPDLDSTSSLRQDDHIDMTGFALNFDIQTHDKTTFTIGGYYNGGSGQSSEFVGEKISIVPATKQAYTLLIATGFAF